ncbi:SRPBCC domain-containing protein [Micromonospora sp. U56]|uniref:SRPBCC domain-containing protein n=1 Tax=Micromonospora sp. U56 TaxID=2824900 RepID=UPI001FFC5649|nr:SRPBCC domain-containing protein [Micromonospora sp. U56]
MTRQKSFKSRVRTRMDKTGESYMAARRHLLPGAVAPEPPTAAPDESTPAAPGSGAAQADRISDALLRERTGRGWDEWFTLLDEWGAVQRTHTETARWLVTAHEVPGWWAQTVTVGYEQARGLRAPGQRRGGGWEAGGSRTVAVPVDRLFEAFSDDRLRRRWLPDVAIRVRTATRPKTFRADWEGGPTRIVVGFAPKGDTKATVTVVHEKLTDAEQAAALRAYWRERLAALKQLLESGEAGR